MNTYFLSGWDFFGAEPKCFLLTSKYLQSPSLRISSCKFLLEKIPGEEVNKFCLKRSSCIRYTFNGAFGGYLFHDIKFTPIVWCRVFRNVLNYGTFFIYQIKPNNHNLRKKRKSRDIYPLPVWNLNNPNTWIYYRGKITYFLHFFFEKCVAIKKSIITKPILKKIQWKNITWKIK